MDIRKVIEKLRSTAGHLEDLQTLLPGLFGESSDQPRTRPKRQTKRRMTLAQKKAVSVRMKRYWKARRAAAR